MTEPNPATADPVPAVPAVPVAASPHPLQHLFDPATIRARCAAVLRSIEDNLSPSFRLDRSRLPDCAARLAAAIREHRPGGDAPAGSVASRLDAGGVPRTAELARALAGRDRWETCRAQADLAVLVALMDTDAGPQWGYDEAQALHRDALPEHRHDNDALLAMLDAAARRPKAGGAALAAALDAVSAHGDDSAVSAHADAPATGQGPADAAPDAGAPPHRLHHGEGLAVALLRAFMGGAFSADRGDALRCDASTLKLLDATALRALMQAGPANPLAGLEERAAMLQRLGTVLADDASRRGGMARPSRILDRLTADGSRTTLGAPSLLRELAMALAPIWAEGSRVQGLPAGDVWPHRWAGDALADGRRDTTTPGHVPLHGPALRALQALLEPLQAAGIEVTGVELLPGPSDPRAAGLLLEAGVLVPRARPAAGRTLKPADEWVIEWRAATVSLLDELAVLVRAESRLDATALPVARLLDALPTASGTDHPPVTLAGAGTLL